jgi:hypothetical protein
LRAAVSTGISFEDDLPGAIPEYIEREAARFGGYRWHEWEALPVAARNHGIAHYRAYRLIEMHESEAVSEGMERQRNAADRRSRRITGSAR